MFSMFPEFQPLSTNGQETCDLFAGLLSARDPTKAAS